MKNLLIFTREDKQLSEENKTLAKIQIDNSLELGWQPEDIVILTNFPYSYGGIKTIEVPDLSYKPDKTNKIPAIVYMFDRGLIKDDVYWYHDWDAFENYSVQDLKLDVDLGLTGYGYKDQWCCGSFFFKPGAEDMIRFWNSSITPRSRADEKALVDLTREGKLNVKRYKELNITYDFGQRLPDMPEIYKQADKPLRVLHFHPHYKYYKARENNLNMFMYGKNKLGFPIMSDRLIGVFNKHGIS